MEIAEGEERGSERLQPVAAALSLTRPCARARMVQILALLVRVLEATPTMLAALVASFPIAAIGLAVGGPIAFKRMPRSDTRINRLGSSALQMLVVAISLAVPLVAAEWMDAGCQVAIALGVGTWTVGWWIATAVWWLRSWRAG